MINDFKRLHSRMTTAINELERLGIDDDDFDYESVRKDYADIVHKLEHRREVIQRRRYG